MKKVLEVVGQVAVGLALTAGFMFYCALLWHGCFGRFARGAERPPQSVVSCRHVKPPVDILDGAPRLKSPRPDGTCGCGEGGPCVCGCTEGGVCLCGPGCTCGAKRAKTMTYSEGHDKAYTEDRPFVVWVSSAEPDRSKLPGCVVVRVDSYRGDRESRVVIGKKLPGVGMGEVTTLPGTPTEEDVRAAVERRVLTGGATYSAPPVFYQRPAFYSPPMFGGGFRGRVGGCAGGG